MKAYNMYDCTHLHAPHNITMVGHQFLEVSHAKHGHIWHSLELGDDAPLCEMAELPQERAMQMLVVCEHYLVAWLINAS
jgi:hypothetical protein